MKKPHESVSVCKERNDMNEQKIQPVRGLHLAVENGKIILENICNEVEITIFFAEEEPA